MRGGEGDRHEQVGALGGCGRDGAIRDMVGIAVAASGYADRHDRALVDHAVGQGDTAAVMRIDGEGRDRDGVVLLRVIDNVFLRQRITSVHPSTFADVELGRPMVGLGELVAAEAKFSHRGADLRRHGVVGRQELIELERVLLMFFP